MRYDIVSECVPGKVPDFAGFHDLVRKGRRITVVSICKARPSRWQRPRPQIGGTPEEENIV